jgi:hypothetical protein
MASGLQLLDYLTGGLPGDLSIRQTLLRVEDMTRPSRLGIGPRQIGAVKNRYSVRENCQQGLENRQKVCSRRGCHRYFLFSACRRRAQTRIRAGPSRVRNNRGIGGAATVGVIVLLFLLDQCEPQQALLSEFSPPRSVTPNT